MKNMTRETFEKLIHEKIVLLDGATGSNLYKAGMKRGQCTESWVLAHPEVETALIKSYVSAGSDIVIAPTFGANRPALSRYGLEDKTREMNSRLVELALKAVDGNAYVAADLAPTGLILESQGGEASIEQIFEAYQEQTQAAMDAGADLVIIETQMSVDEAVIALDAVQSVTDVPVLCSFSVNADGYAYYGGSILDAIETLQEMGASAVGVNCCTGPDQLESLVTNIKKAARIPVIAKPNAGMPQIDDEGNAVYSMRPEIFAMHMKKLVEAGAGVIGGCCGTDPNYIKKIRLMLDGVNLI